MNPRFKFRAWNKEEKQMYYDAENTYDYMTGNPMIFAESFSCLLTNDEWIIEQCTGVKDKNGNLIYEGDIVKCGNATGIVCFGFYRRADEHFPDSIYGYYIEWKQSDFRQDFGYWATEERIEIIGNIHEQQDTK